MADEYTLTILDTAGIQDYIFGSNVLRENIGASQLVWAATSVWPLEIFRDLDLKTNIAASVTELRNADLLDDRRIDEHALDVEVVYAGGGNVLVLFKARNTAVEFVRRLSRRLLTQAPGLELAVVHVPAQIEAFKDASEKARKLLAKKKQNRPATTPLLGLGVTMACRSTGLPAVGDDAGLMSEEAAPRPLSADIIAKLRAAQDANKRLGKIVEDLEHKGLKIPYDFDNFGREEGANYIAVVHADGNRMGEHKKAISDKYAGRELITELRKFACRVEEAGQEAVHKLWEHLSDNWGDEHQPRTLFSSILDREIRLAEALNRKRNPTGDHYIPFRPLVFGGDDLTFVANGQLGLTLAAAYLRFFEEAINRDVSEKAEKITACAGVAVVKTHYPFARAYQLAEQLCENAKRTFDRENSALDWHFAATGLFGRISEIRERQYEVKEGSLTMRPVALEKVAAGVSVEPWRTWPIFANAVKTFLLDEPWRDSRNKVIALRQPLREGSVAVTRFRETYLPKKGAPGKFEPLPEIDSGISALQETGWNGAGRCAHFDVIEALDFFFPLELSQ